SVREHDGDRATSPRGHVRIVRQPGSHPGASHSCAQELEAEGPTGQAAVDDGDGGAASQDARRLSSVPPRYPRWPPAVESLGTPESRMIRKNHVRFGGGRMEKVPLCAVTGLHRRNLASRLPYIIWGFQHVAGFRRRHVGALIHEAWTDSLEAVRATLDASVDD